MPNYRLSYVVKTYEDSANPPILDRVVFTIDHIHHGGAGVYSTYDVVKYLVSLHIPVTVFLQCSDPLNNCPVERTSARQIYLLAPHLVSFGTHSLSPGNSQLTQRNNLSLIQNVIADTTGRRSRVMSYHGNRAGPERGISYAGIDYARGIKVSQMGQRENRLDTPVMGMGSVSRAFDYISARNTAGLAATLFVHSAELRNGSPQKRVFDTLIKEVRARHLQAVPYETAMRQDFGGSQPTRPSQPHRPPTRPEPTEPSYPPVIPEPDYPELCPPLAHLSSGVLSQNLRKYDRDRRHGIAQVAELQRFLNELDLGAGVADGIFGNKTKLAVISYQILKGLVPDGIIGPITRASINSFCDY